MKRLMLWIGIAATFAVVGCKKSVPKVEGQDLKTATSKLEQSGFKLGAVSKVFTGTGESGIVVSQNPAAATKVAKGSVVDVTVEESVTLPAFVGLDLLSALRAAGSQGLRIAGKNKPTKDAPAGTVLDQSPLAGQRVPPGTQVELLIAGVKGPFDYLDEKTKSTFKNLLEEKLSEEASRLLDGNHGKDKDKDKEKNKDPHHKDGNGKGVGKVIGDEFDKEFDKAFDKGLDKAFGKDAAKDFGKDTAKEFGKDIAKDASRKLWGVVKGFGRKNSVKGGDKADSDSSDGLAAPAQLSPYQGENVNAVANRVNFAWSQVAGAASYTVEVETFSGANWVKLGTKSGLIETRFSATIAVHTARWRVRAVDSKQKDGQSSTWATFALLANGENVSTPVQHEPAQVVSK
jgi:hypothetical protein